MVEVVGESRMGMLLVLPLLSLRRRSRSFSDGVGELRWDAKSSFLRSASSRLRILWITTCQYFRFNGDTFLDRKAIFFV